MAEKKVIPKDILMILYVEESKSAKMIAERFNITVNTVIARLREYGIPVRNWSEANKLKLQLYGPARPKGSIPWNKGIPRTGAEKINISLARRGIPGLSGEYSARWKGGKSLTKGGYIEAWIPKDSPFVSMAQENDKHGKRVLEHRLVMAQHLGRPLDKKKEIVHHLNGIRTDNRIENLVLVQRVDHERWTLVNILKAEILRLQQILERNQIAF